MKIIAVLLFSIVLCSQTTSPPDKNAITVSERLALVALNARSSEVEPALAEARAQVKLLEKMEAAIQTDFQALSDRAIAARGYKKGEAGFDPNVGVVPIPKTEVKKEKP